jgi:enolase-phosphatase E1
LDIEGTTSSIKFVVDEMFPFVRRQLAEFLKAYCQDTGLPNLLTQIVAEAKERGFSESTQQPLTESASQAVHFLMDQDAKVTGLKQLQGMIWENGFRSGQLIAHVYEDVVPQLELWSSRSKGMRIYSSGSIAAQKLFFGHTLHGDLLGFFQAHYDTTIGGKREQASYAIIARDWGLEPRQIAFISDVVEELIAADTAGMETFLSVRPGNPPQGIGHGFREIQSFAEVDFE